MSLLSNLKKSEDPIRYLTREAIFRVLDRIDPEAATRHLHRSVTGKELDLDDPREFNEKLQWLKLYWQDPLMTVCADKYAVRDYVREKGCGDTLNELYGVYDGPVMIDWDELPERFVLKCTHGCGYNIFCTDSRSFDRYAAARKLGAWLKKDYGKYMGERHYKGIQPRIICERHLEEAGGGQPPDFKVYCFNGRPRLVLTARDRFTSVKYGMYDLAWNRMDVFDDKVVWDETTLRPDCLNELLDCAARLAEPFPFVRADFYVIGGRPVFGELTFTPAGGMWRSYNDYGSRLLGSMLELPERSRGFGSETTDKRHHHNI